MNGTILLLVIAAWFAIGVVLSLTLGRRGHDGFGWFVLGTLLGPAAILFALEARHEERMRPRVLSNPGGPDRGHVDVLVGFDGSPESRACAEMTVELVGSRLGRLTLATVVPFDGGTAAERSAIAAVEAEAKRLARLAPGVEVLHGHPATALAARARADGYEVLAIGTRGTGRAHLFGSAASELARNSPVPVLLVSAPDGATGALGAVPG